MRIYSVESKNLFFVNFLDFKIRIFSPRELFYSLVGAWIFVSAIQETISQIFGLLGAIVFIFGYIPYKFLPFEIQLINFLRFHLSNNSASKKAKKEPSSLLGYGDVFMPEIINDDEIPKDTGPEVVTIQNLDEPYTITLKTNTKKRFLPVSIHVDDILVSNCTTDRKGDISCTILIYTYGVKRFLAKDESENILYDNVVEFVP